MRSTFSARWGGTCWRVSVPFFIAAAAWLTLDASGTAALCLLASFLHEGGHIAALLLCGRCPREVAVGVCGVRLVPDERPLSYGRQALVLLAGPAVNLLSAVLLALCGGNAVAVAAHGLLGGFNLLPIEALDGGQCLRCLVAARWGGERAERVTRGVSVAVLLPLSTAGFFLLLRGGNATLLAVSVYLTVRLFAHERI